MGAAIQLRRKPLTIEEHRHAWQVLCDDATLAGIPYKIETDAWGGVCISPAQTKHSRMVRRVARLLEQKLGGETLTELAIVTAEGVKVPDVAWCSEAFLTQHWSDVALLKAPEVRIEVVSPSNSEAELRSKTEHYLRLGAIEVWLVSEGGAVEVHTATGGQDNSTFGFDPAAELSS
jgi:Uma2 family endonuclease